MIKSRRFDTLVYLAPTSRSAGQIHRDKTFFRAVGIKNFIGTGDFARLERKQAGTPLKPMDKESNLLLNRLASSGLSAAAHPPSFNLNLGLREETVLHNWLRGKPDGGRRWLAVGPGSKMPAKQWPVERFEAVVHKLIEQFEVWPVVFGGPEDSATAEKLLRSWNCGYNAAGPLDIRSAALALKHCLLYLGNDTGTMHLAAAVGVPCVAIFSARERPGLWYPHGDNNRVFRAEIDCEGCGLSECLERKNECLRIIATQPVADSCATILRNHADFSIHNRD